MIIVGEHENLTKVRDPFQRVSVWYNLSVKLFKASWFSHA
jgi:hypothetical protein